MTRISLELERRRKAGLPAEVLDQVGWVAGMRVLVRVNRRGAVVLERASEVLEKLVGAAPGMTSHAFGEDVEDSVDGMPGGGR
jgi:bifunctional DNA-binding transcriptional regulator/antitoxin component of YhaV-PrlF toxin-antitoxin module